MAYQFSMRSSVRRRSQKCVSTVGQDGTESHIDAHGQHSQKCVSTVGQDGTESHIDAHGQHSQKCVSTVGQDGTESHIDAHGQHSQKCVSTVGQDGTESHVDAHGQHSQKCVCPLWVKTAQNCTSTLTVNTHRSVCPLWVKTACIWLVPHMRHLGSKPDSVRSLAVSNRADHIKVVNSMSDVHGLWKYIAVCFHTGWIVLEPCTMLGNIRIHSSV